MLRIVDISCGIRRRGILPAALVLLLFSPIGSSASGIHTPFAPVPGFPVAVLFPGSQHAYPEDAPPPEGAAEGAPVEPAEQQQEQPQWPGIEQPAEEPPPPQHQPSAPPESQVAPPGQAPGASKPVSPAGTGSFGRLKGLDGAVQRFYRFTGERTVTNLAALFDSAPSRQAGLHQEPSIAVSDGSSPVSIKLEPGLGTVTFSFSGAHSDSLTHHPDGTWDLTITPLQGKYLVYLSVLSGGEVVDIPLSVIPPAEEKIARETGNFSEPKVAELLSAASKQDRLVYDLNHDGKQNYLDDYILIGQYLINHTHRTTPDP